MQLLHKISKFGASISDMKTIYFAYIRSNVWHSSLSQENIQNLERVQKAACKIILQQRYIDYESACSILDIQDLYSRRQEYFEKFTLHNTNHPQFIEYFKENDNMYHSSIRKSNKFKISQTNTERFKKSASIPMQTDNRKEHG